MKRRPPARVSGNTLLRDPRRRHSTARPRVERLDGRILPSASPVTGSANALTIDQARMLGDLSVLPFSSATAGTIGAGAATSSDVSWYAFTLDSPAHVSLTLSGARTGASLAGVLGLYNDDTAVPDFGDPDDPTGHRLLARVQASAPGATATLTSDLAAGKYEVAVSGAGDLDFNPYIADSGEAGPTGGYTLKVAALPILALPGSGPSVLTTVPASGAAVSQAPQVIRADLTAPLDPSTLIPGQTVNLVYNPTGAFGNGQDQAVPIAWVNFSATISELQIGPEGALAPGFYKVELSGKATDPGGALAAPDGTPLGASLLAPQGKDASWTFQVTGFDGGTGASARADDTVATAHNLGTLAPGASARITGVIGDDPYYTGVSFGLDPADDVDMYHFQVTNPAGAVLDAQVDAGRIGSTLQAGLSLFRRDPTTGAVTLVDSSFGSNDPTVGTDGTFWLLNDPVMQEVLPPGDYYLAVASSHDTSAPSLGHEPGTFGYFDPTVSHSGGNGGQAGPYVLQLSLAAPTTAPTVTSVSLAEGSVLAQAPTTFSVAFSAPVDLSGAATASQPWSATNPAPEVYFVSANGTVFVPGLSSYDTTTNVATFQMLDRLTTGTYTLHISGAAGVRSTSGVPLAGNDSSGDDVVHFSVRGVASPLASNGSGAYEVSVGLDTQRSVNLGVVYLNEIRKGVTSVTTQDAAPLPADHSTVVTDSYTFTVLQAEDYAFYLGGASFPSDVRLALFDQSGHALKGVSIDGGLGLKSQLSAGTYTLKVTGWTAGEVAGLVYQITWNVLGTGNSAPLPLVGPTVPLSFHVAGVESPAYGPTDAAAAKSGTPSAEANEPGPAFTEQANGPGAAGGLGLVALAAGPVGGVTPFGTGATAGAAVIQVSTGTPMSQVASGVIGLVGLHVLGVGEGAGEVEAVADVPGVEAVVLPDRVEAQPPARPAQPAVAPRDLARADKAGPVEAPAPAVAEDAALAGLPAVAEVAPTDPGVESTADLAATVLPPATDLRAPADPEPTRISLTSCLTTLVSAATIGVLIARGRARRLSWRSSGSRTGQALPARKLTTGPGPRPGPRVADAETPHVRSARPGAGGA